ncbi:hypothetical protein Dimus_032419 [Dionaea muscipula]
MEFRYLLRNEVRNIGARACPSPHWISSATGSPQPTTAKSFLSLQCLPVNSTHINRLIVTTRSTTSVLSLFATSGFCPPSGLCSMAPQPCQSPATTTAAADSETLRRNRILSSKLYFVVPSSKNNFGFVEQGKKRWLRL